MLTLVASLLILSGNAAAQDEIVRRCPPAEVPTTPTGGQLASPTADTVVTANTELNCMFGGRAVPCAADAPGTVEETDDATEKPDIASHLWNLFDRAASDGSVSAEPGYSRSRAAAARTADTETAPQPRTGCRREEQRSADGTSVSVQMVCGNDSEAQRAVTEFLNRPD